MEITNIINDIKSKNSNIKSVYFVGCGASNSDLYPAKYFMDNEAKRLRSSLCYANEFVHATPAGVGSDAIVITCSLGGSTPETVAASKQAMELGAHVISVTHDGNSALANACHYCIVNGWEDGYSGKIDKMIQIVRLAAEILNTFEGYEYYDAMLKGLNDMYGIIDHAVTSVKPQAKVFAQNYKNDDVIYVMSSGATHKVAYAFSICLLMEMQWMNSGSFHDGEFFHGPFEITDKDVPFLLLMNDGRTRALDARALDFLQRFDAKVTVVDAKDFGLGSKVASKIVDYMNPMLLSAIVRVYAEQLSIARNHPLTKRRYMWKLTY